MHLHAKSKTAAPAARRADRRRPAEDSAAGDYRSASTCPCGGGCPRCQAKAKSSPPVSLKLSRPDDAAEREADTAADQVTRAIQAVSSPETGPNLKTGIRMSPHPGASTAVNSNALSAVHDVLRSPGQRLSPEARTMMEPHFGRDFSDVRVHDDARAAASARAVDAHAYTAGNDLVFGAGRYDPFTSAGRHLLAHELAHVAQGNEGSTAGAVTLRRAPATKDLTSIPRYEWTGAEQKKSANSVSPAYINLSYDDAAGKLTCTFRLRWRFPPKWAEAVRASYIEEFVKTVKAAWENKFPVVKYDKGKPSSTTAQVSINFDHARALDMSTTGDETAYVNWLLSPAGAATKDRWTMNVHDSFQFRDRVDAPNVHLDAGANQAHPVDTSSYSDKTYTNLGSGGKIQGPPYQHYFDLGITPSKGPASGGNYTQTTSAHEFGHMIGLADEYVMSAEDYNDLSNAQGKPAADAALRRRKSASARIQNIGGQVTRDAYRPFADFLSTLTGDDWRVK